MIFGNVDIETSSETRSLSLLDTVSGSDASEELFLNFLDSVVGHEGKDQKVLRRVLL